jgi:hypothetical protein
VDLVSSGSEASDVLDQVAALALDASADQVCNPSSSSQGVAPPTDIASGSACEWLPAWATSRHDALQTFRITLLARAKAHNNDFVIADFARLHPDLVGAAAWLSDAVMNCAGILLMVRASMCTTVSKSHAPVGGSHWDNAWECHVGRQVVQLYSCARYAAIHAVSSLCCKQVTSTTSPVVFLCGGLIHRQEASQISDLYQQGLQAHLWSGVQGQDMRVNGRRTTVVLTSFFLPALCSNTPSAGRTRMSDALRMTHARTVLMRDLEVSSVLELEYIAMPTHTSLHWVRSQQSFMPQVGDSSSAYLEML